MLSLLQSEVNPVGTEPMTDMAVSWLSSLICIGALHGIPVFGHLCNRYSRKMTDYLIAISGIIGWTLIMLASTELMLFVSRFPLST
ncbi:hypothetical protein PR048_022809 [Dryococelus australis]|uniref:Major facilitator superfamily (MFS) profile domain-containing protein n=1 Tax=Dryococelus australis TaxID=614101 RepID=A0ABQ9GSE9_9NEOP|nr:hypothetical protein PR048_022809 [Dryococelus australis]